MNLKINHFLCLLILALLSLSAVAQPLRQDARQYVKPLFHQSGSGAQAAVEETFPGFTTPRPQLNSVPIKDDSLGLSMYYYRPPLRVEDVLSEFFGGLLIGLAGAAGGAIVGALAGYLLESTGSNVWVGDWAALGALCGGFLGIPTGIWWGGKNYYSIGNYWITLGSFIAGLFASFLVGYLGQEAEIFLVGLSILPIAGGMLGYNFSRKWRISEEQFYEQFETEEENLYYEYLNQPPALPNRVPHIPGPQFRIFRLLF